MGIVKGIFCLTYIDNTEHRETLREGENKLLTLDPEAIGPDMERLLSGNWKTGKPPFPREGETASLIIDKILEFNDI